MRILPLPSLELTIRQILDLASQITNVEKLLEGSDSLFYPTQIQGLSTIDENSLKKMGLP
mgnify:CR=1 FL=1